MPDAIEQWHPVLGYEGKYEVSDHGRVRSLPGGKRQGKILTPIKQHHGHVMVSLYDGFLKQKFIHELVLESFDQPRPEGLFCRHLNGDPTDNRVENLKWGTALENARDMVRHGTCWQTQKTHCPSGHEYNSENTRYYGRRRYCIPCNIARSRAWQAARRESIDAPQ